MRYAVEPGGSRIRPRIAIAVAMACGDDLPSLSEAAAAAIELMHCASLVHDDLPCFDNANFRRSNPAVHVKFGEGLAVLAGDALILMAIRVMSGELQVNGVRASAMLRALVDATSMPNGICAGQAWEMESECDTIRYHTEKTSALFVASTRMGALAAGNDPSEWIALGENLGAAYQIADDMIDTSPHAIEAGKPVHQDKKLHRPNLVTEIGVKAAIDRMHSHLDEAIASIPVYATKTELCVVLNELKNRLTLSVSASN